MAIVKKLEVAGLATPGGHYAHATVANGFLFISGLLALDESQALRGETAAAQAAYIFETMARILVAAEASLNDVAKLTIYLTDIADRQAVNAVRASVFGTHRPASTLVEISRLAVSGAVVEIEATAVLR